jgi:hypothetical protein
MINPMKGQAIASIIHHHGSIQFQCGEILWHERANPTRCRIPPDSAAIVRIQVNLPVPKAPNNPTIFPVRHSG